MQKLEKFFCKYCKSDATFAGIKIDEPAFERLFPAAAECGNRLEDSMRDGSRPSVFASLHAVLPSISSVHKTSTLWLRGPGTPNPKWAYLSHDEYMRPNRYRIIPYLIPRQHNQPASQL